MSGSASLSHIEPTQEAGRRFVRRGLAAPVIMLNRLRFRDTADDAHHPGLAPSAPISGAEAFDRYIRHTLPLLRESGGDLLFLGTGGDWLIGPGEERWDTAMLVRQTSTASFLAFASHPGYRAGLGHRTAAMADSRLPPLSEMALPPGPDETDS
ncbi:DUF1330 domain-containing protein [Ancylobacter lacus]|uniref:DUF1330 domain-containing protein n=1 Tax=Ancylobacter lacus TaxID=2579970 RepID=UPI001BCFEEB0|nr:DUF1330 domain-containing protein [Ancylobacter lacus]MBS7541393.1 DUF1330 domain-containing protein [Ancylobacter lacus]